MSRYLAALQGSWEALCAGDRDGRVLRTSGFLAASSSDEFLNNGVLLQAQALPELCEVYGDGDAFAVWTAADDGETAAALQEAHFTRDVTTRPMLCDREHLPDSGAFEDVDTAVAPAQVAALNGVRAGVLEDVRHLRCFATADGECGLVVQDVGEDVVVSFVATREPARGRGRATRLVTAALRDARERGAAGVLLQATPEAERLYRRLGFRAIGSWQEWTPAPRGVSSAQRNSSRTSSVVGCDWQVSTTPASSSSGSSA